LLTHHPENPKRAQQTFFENFVVGTRGLTSKDAKIHAQNIRIEVCFYRTRGGIDEGWVQISSSSYGYAWRKLIDNVITMRIGYVG
jgi:hypothetical protein